MPNWFPVNPDEHPDDPNNRPEWAEPDPEGSEQEERVSRPGPEPCERCFDEGWIEVFDDEDNVVDATDCPYLNEPWHRPFNASGSIGRR